MANTEFVDIETNKTNNWPSTKQSVFWPYIVFFFENIKNKNK